MIYDLSTSSENDEYSKHLSHNIEMVWELNQGEGKYIVSSQNAIPEYSITHCGNSHNNGFYIKAAFYFSINIDKKEVCLIYHFAPKFGRCLVYQIEMTLEENFVIGNPKTMWVQ